jgi:hypothetical protein
MNTIILNGETGRRKTGHVVFVRLFLFITLIAYFLSVNSCIVQFLPEITEDQDILVVEGLITDQPGLQTIRISTSMPLGTRSTSKPLSGCNVRLSDDLGNSFSMNEENEGTYLTGPSFQASVGRYYTLHIKTNASHHNLNYKSAPMLMKPVPLIDSVYYERVVLERASDGYPSGEGCKIYLNTHDPENSCRFYRWEFTETWEFRLPYIVSNKTCWISNNSDNINIKATTSLSEDKIERQPVSFITNGSDRLKILYSILVNQYSLNEEEYAYWEKLEHTVEQVGSLYDIIPASIPSNIECIENPSENVLGYFSVSSVKSKRVFIKDQFRGLYNPYSDCENVIVPYNDPLLNLGVTIWVIVDHPEPPPGFKVLTYFKGCADCAVRGTTQRPDFWPDY